VTDRTVRVSLTASVSGYIAEMNKASIATKATETAAQKLVAQKEGFRQVGVALLAIGTVAVAAVGLAVKQFADFDAKMSQVKTLSHATTDEMVALSNAALTMGRNIGFSATQTADAEIELVKAGVALKDIMGGALQGSLQLAAAGQIEVGQATEIATIALTQFKLAGRDVPHVADLLAAGADKALGGVGDLGEALKSGGLVASQFGVSLDETVGTLSAFANAGLLGETAGTDLRQMLLKLANPAVQAKNEIKALGLEIYGTNGQFVGINSLSLQLREKLVKLTPEARNSALAIIFGSRAIAGANVLYAEGAKPGGGIRAWTDSVNDSGFAAKQAAGKMDNLNGDLSKLGAAFQTDLIVSGSGANEILRSMVQTVTGLVSAIGDLPAPVLGIGLGLVALVGILALTGGTILTLVPKVQAFKQAMSDSNISVGSLARGVGIASVALVLAGLVLSKIAGDQAASTARTQEFQASLDQATGAVTSYTRALAAKSLEEKGAFEDAKKYGITQQELTDAVLNGGAALDVVRAKLNAYNKPLVEAHDRGAALANQSDHLSGSLSGVTAELVDGEKAQRNIIAATEAAAGSTQGAADAYQAAADKASKLNSEIQKLTDEINKANGVGQDAVSANAAYQKALADTTDYIKKAHEGVKGYSLGVENNTVAGSANLDMLGKLARQNEDTAAKQLALDGDTSAYHQTLKDGHDVIVANALALGATAERAQEIAGIVSGMPDQKLIDILVNTSKATQDLNAFLVCVNGSKIDLKVGAIVRPGQVAGFAAGGYTGDHPKTAVAGVVHGREYVSNAMTTANPSNRAALDFMQSGGVVRGYAGGGYVAPPMQSYYMGGGGQASSGAQVSVQINPSVGMSEETIGRVAVNELNFALRGN
jgi:TP901 family phage tail tape measure protein